MRRGVLSGTLARGSEYKREDRHMMRREKNTARTGHKGCRCCYPLPDNATLRKREERMWWQHDNNDNDDDE